MAPRSPRRHIQPALCQPRNPFDHIPIETTQNIAAFIESDIDLCAFRVACRSTHDAIEADHGSFWRRRFLDHFEKPVVNSEKDLSTAGYKRQYQKRKSALKCGAKFASGETDRERRCLEVLRDLIVDSFSEKTDDKALTYHSANLEYVKKFVIDNQLLHLFIPRRQWRSRTSTMRNCASPPPPSTSSLLLAIQAMCAPLLLSFEPALQDVFGFPDSQAVVYGTANAHPIFTGCHSLDVNMKFVLHNINFWKYHMLREAEATLFPAFSALDEDELPRWWDSALRGGVRKLGKHWKGSYAFVDRTEIDDMREGNPEDQQIQDIFAGEDGMSTFQDMTLELTPDDQKFTWPDMFEQHLRATTMPANRAKTRAQHRSAKPEAVVTRPQSFHFEGDGEDASEKFLASGWLNELPPQEGVPGWQRITMMKYFEEDDGSIDTQGLWAYEGVVLPGGQVIVGRWWSPWDPADDAYSGPFILWCVDGAQHAEEEMEEV